MSLSVQPVTKHNWRELAKLKVRDDQTHFVATNIHSIAESQFGYDHPDDGHWDMAPYGIYDGDVPVGFLMIGYNLNNPKMQGYVIRLMVDEQHQGKGYGKFGMNWILDHYRSDERIKRIGISYEPDNDVARKMYAGLGFVETGEIDHGEVVAQLQIH
jgi:diamine N-acetyltransferase